MSYTETVNLIFSGISYVICLLFSHYIVIAAVSLFACKKYPHADHKNRYGLIVPAKNEETVIGALIQSVRSADYPQELLDIFVIAHNCSDRTADIARKADTHVYEYNNPNENTMGYAIRYLFDRIDEDFGTSSYDGFFIFNADNTFEKDYFEKMNDAFEYYGRKFAITSFRQASNFNENLITVMYGAYFASSCYLGARGRTVLGTSARIFGCGYVFNSNLVKNGWDYYSLTEDLEFSTREFMKGTEIRYCDDAVFYDEQPTSFRVMWRQRLRWARGIIIVSKAHLANCIKAIFDPGRKNRFAVFDMSTFISRIIICIIMLFLLRSLLLFFAPLFGESMVDAFLYWDSTKPWWHNLFQSRDTGALFSVIAGFINAYVVAMVAYLLTMLLGRKRFRSVSVGKAALGLFLFPLFVLSQFVIDIHALFSKNLVWKQIPHTGRRDSH